MIYIDGQVHNHPSRLILIVSSSARFFVSTNIRVLFSASAIISVSRRFSLQQQQQLCKAKYTSATANRSPVSAAVMASQIHVGDCKPVTRLSSSYGKPNIRRPLQTGHPSQQQLWQAKYMSATANWSPVSAAVMASQIYVGHCKLVTCLSSSYGKPNIRRPLQTGHLSQQQLWQAKYTSATAKRSPVSAAVMASQIHVGHCKPVTCLSSSYGKPNIRRPLQTGHLSQQQLWQAKYTSAIANRSPVSAAVMASQMYVNQQ